MKKEIEIGGTSPRIRKVAEVDLDQGVMTEMATAECIGEMATACVGQKASACDGEMATECVGEQVSYRVIDVEGAFSGFEEACGNVYPGLLFGGGRKSNECWFVPVVGESGFPEECYAQDAETIPRLTTEALIDFLRYSQTATFPGRYVPEAAGAASTSALPNASGVPSASGAPCVSGAAGVLSVPATPAVALTSDEADELRRLLGEALSAAYDLRFGCQTPEDAYYAVTMPLDRALKMLWDRDAVRVAKEG